MKTMSEKKIINILENEGLTLTHKITQSIPMGRAIHFTFTLPKEEVSKEMIKRFGRDFNRYEDGENEAVFLVGSGLTLTRIKD